MDKNTEKQNGFTLIELMITMVVFSFGLLGLAGLQGQMIRANSFNRDMLIVQTIGADLIEETKVPNLTNLGTLFFTVDNTFANRVPYGDIDGDGVIDLDIDGDGNSDDPYNGRYTWTRTRTPAGPGTFTVNVTVFWDDPFRPATPHQQSFPNIVPAPL